MEELNEEEFQTEYEIVDLIRMRLYQKRHGLAAVLGAVEIRVADRDGVFETDGKSMYLDRNRLRKTFMEGSGRLCLELLHMLCHCLLGHVSAGNRNAGDEGQYRQAQLDLEAWILVERIWGEELPFLEEAEEYPEKQAGLLYVDSHENWLKNTQQDRLKRAFGENGDRGEGLEGSLSGHLWDLSDWWLRQGEVLRRECVLKQRKAGTARRNRVSRQLVPASGHRGDYRAILQSFSSFREESGGNPEEFQYAWYLYGLEHYGNMPLIEPLEYREGRKISDLVIVIDTSGSCERDLVRIFLEETKGILEQAQLFFRQFCLHVIQCDNQIQRDDRIENREEFEKYLEQLEIRGGGGTDFSPAFRHVEKLRAQGELRDLRGMLYFTDGSGLYPKEEPDYAVWFVMLEGSYDAIDMPDWIHRLILKAVI